MTAVVAVLSFLGAFLAGWLVATEKNRAEVYKRRMQAYDEVFANLQALAIIAVANNHDLIKENDVTSAKIALLQKRLSNVLYLSEGFTESIAFASELESMSTDDILKNFSKAAGVAAKDLHLKQHNIITSITVGELDILRGQSTSLAQNPKER